MAFCDIEISDTSFLRHIDSAELISRNHDVAQKREMTQATQTGNAYLSHK